MSVCLAMAPTPNVLSSTGLETGCKPDFFFNAQLICFKLKNKIYIKHENISYRSFFPLRASVKKVLSCSITNIYELKLNTYACVRVCVCVCMCVCVCISMCTLKLCTAFYQHTKRTMKNVMHFMYARYDRNFCPEFDQTTFRTCKSQTIIKRVEVPTRANPIKFKSV